MIINYFVTVIGVGSLSFGSEPKDEMWDVPSLENVDPALLKPISDTSKYLTTPVCGGTQQCSL